MTCRMRLRALAGLGLLACIGVGGTAVGCYDDPGAGPRTAFSVRRYPTAPTGQQTIQPPPQSTPPGRFSDFPRGVKGKP
jgi:hypothetical protein